MILLKKNNVLTRINSTFWMIFWFDFFPFPGKNSAEEKQALITSIVRMSTNTGLAILTRIKKTGKPFLCLLAKILEYNRFLKAPSNLSLNSNVMYLSFIFVLFFSFCLPCNVNYLDLLLICLHYVNFVHIECFVSSTFRQIIWFLSLI